MSKGRRGRCAGKGDGRSKQQVFAARRRGGKSGPPMYVLIERRRKARDEEIAVREANEKKHRELEREKLLANPCTTCGASPGLPCVTISLKRCQPHKGGRKGRNEPCQELK